MIPKKKVHPDENETNWETKTIEAQTHFLKAMDAIEGMPEEIRVRTMSMMLDASPELEDVAVRRKEKKGGGQKQQATSTRTSPPSPPPPRKVGGEDNDGDDDLKPAASKAPAPTSVKPPSLEGSGEDSIEDDTDVNEVELPDSEPVNTSTTFVESSTTGAPSAGNSEHITECATAWSVVGFALTTAQTCINAAFALTKDDVYSDFYAWVVKPICFTAMAVSFMLKPRRSDSTYMTFLYAQYAILTLVCEVSEAPTSPSSLTFLSSRL